MTHPVYWRCFHCGETFTRAQERWAREHFGADQIAEPVCLIRSASRARARGDLCGVGNV